MKQQQLNLFQFENRFNRRNIDVDKLLDDRIRKNQNMHSDSKTEHDDGDTINFDESYRLYKVSFTRVDSIISKTNGVLVDNCAFSERLSLMFKVPFCAGAVCFSLKDPRKLEILRILGQNSALKDYTDYELYIALLSKTTNALNKINETIFREFLLDCANFDIMCIYDKFNFNNENDLFFQLLWKMNMKNSVLAPCSWGIFDQYLEDVVQ